MTKILLYTGPSPRSLHRLDSWLYCNRWFAFNHVHGVKVAFPPAEPLVRGTLVHVGMAHLNARRWAVQNGEDPEAYYAPNVAIDLVAEKERTVWGSLSDVTRPVAQKAVALFEQSGHGQDSTIGAVEKIIEFPVTGPRTGRVWRYTQRVDLLEKIAGRIYVTDWKTNMGHFKQDTLDRYAASLQFLAFRWWAPQMFGKDFGGARVGLIGLSENTFRIVNVAPAPALVHDFPLICEQAELAIERAEADGCTSARDYTPAANERVCMTSYGKCAAWNHCLWGKTDAPVNTRLLSFTWNEAK